MAPAVPASHVFLALAAIVAAAQAFGWIARRCGQPAVVGEMIAGIVLGPSCLGLMAPAVQAWLFPSGLKPVLGAGAQLGVGLYMFVVGLETDRAAIRASLRPALAVSLGGMAAPFAAGALLAPWLIGRPGLFAPSLGPVSAGLFLGACLAITAFPMLARIIHERGLHGTRLGALALAAGAIDDAAAWIMLAIVLAAFAGTTAAAAMTIGAAALLALALLGPVRTLLARLDRGGTGKPGPVRLALMLLLFLLAAAASDAIGMHAVFGGFLLGLAVPRGDTAGAIRRRIEPLTVALLLPIFFLQSGLNTRLDLLLSPALIGPTIAIIAAAVLAKAGACWAAARIAGEDRATALGLGALMNARGLMELIIINIGLSHGIIGPPLFAMLAAIAAITTLAAGPLFTRAMRRVG